jgi:regulatory protein
LQLIARAEQNIFGLTRKLEKRGYDPVCTRTVISELCELGLLDDRRYARLWLESKITRHTSSPRRLLIALCARGINRDDANFVLKEVLNDEIEYLLLKRYAEKLKRRRDSIKSSLKYLFKSEGFSSLLIERFFDEGT